MKRIIYLFLALLLGVSIVSGQTNEKDASVTVTFPNGGEHWIKNTYNKHNITWESTDVTSFKIEFSSDNGTSWTVIEDNYSGGNFYSWLSADIISEECLIKVSDANGNVEDLSDEVFTVSEQTIYIAEWNTSMGTMRAELRGDLVPMTVQNFINLSEKGFYTDLIFHRVISGFMIQDGCPLGTGYGGPGYSFDDEFDDALRHNSAGILSMANAGPNTNGSQYFITLDATAWLDDAHAVFGRILDGMDVLFAIGDVETDGNDRPIVDVNLTIGIVESNPELTLINPESEFGAFAGTTINIEWESDFVADVKIEFSNNNGNDWITLTDSIPSDNEAFEWNVPEELSDECFIKITSLRNDAVLCQNALPFAIREMPLKLERLEFYENVEATTENIENLVFPGKSLRFKLKVLNNYTEDLNAVSAELTSNSEYITITTSEVSFASVLQGEEQWSETEFEILLSEEIPFEGEYELTISASDANITDAPCFGYFRIPVLKLFPFITIDDDDIPDSQGNDNNNLDPDETIELIPKFDNKGQDILFNVYGQLSSPNYYINIWNEITGADEIVYDTAAYNNSQPINPNATGMAPIHDFVFDYNADDTYYTDFVLKIFGYINEEQGTTWDEGGMLLKWAIPIILNENYPVSIENQIDTDFNIRVINNMADKNVLVYYNFDKNINENLYIFMYNIQGIKLKEFVINSAKTGHTIVDYNNIPAGVYLLKMQKGKNTITKKIVIN